MSNLLARLLKKLASAVIWKYRPGIIGVTGSVGKTSTKRAIAVVLGSNRQIRAAPASLNNEFGVPLTILGEWNSEELALVSKKSAPGGRTLRKIFFWLKVIVRGAYLIVFSPKSNYPEILILEYGADRPGDIKYLLSIARPNISVITAVGEIPVHVEFYAGPEEVAREKARLIECLPSAGFAVLNYDDARVRDLDNRTRAHVMTYGFGQGAQVRISGLEHRLKNNAPVGIGFKLSYGGGVVPVKLDGVLSKSQAYAAAAAACLGLIFGLNLVKISEALKDYRPAPGRLELKVGVGSSWVIDDSYNASPAAMRAALDTLRILPGKRKIAVLGDMLELGKYTTQAHSQVGRLVARSANILVTIGPAAKFIAEGAKTAGLPKRNIYSFMTAPEAQEPLANLIRRGDLILVKGSRAMHLEEVVAALRAAPGIS